MITGPGGIYDCFYTSKLDIKCDEVIDDCKMLHVCKRIDFESAFLQHMGVGVKIFDKANALICCLL